LQVTYGFSGAQAFYSREEYVRILKSNRFVHHDVRYGLPFFDGTADHIYASHFLEHLFFDEAKHFLKETYRVLKQGGLIRIAIPDLEFAFFLYQRGQREQALGYFFSTSKIGALSRHQYMYDFALISQLLREVGFQSITRRSFREGRTPDLDLLDNRPEETLFVEALR
jgi:predicted SAM-dependent methyltransferase